MITTSPVPDFITVEDAKKHLVKTDDADDAELEGFVSAACSMIVDRIGQVSAVEAVDEADHRGFRRLRAIVLEDHPVVSVTAVQVVGGETVPAADPDNHVDGWVLDGGAGVLRHTGLWPRGIIRVTYTAGRVPLPGNVRLAALELTSHMWRSMKLNATGGRPALSGMDEVVMPGAAYALPFRVRELLGLGAQPTAEPLVG